MAKTRQTRASRNESPSPSAEGKHLVIVESPAKARTINRYLGSDYVVKASIGHVSDLPSKAPKGKAKEQPVPGVDLDNDFRPTYEILPGKKAAVTELKRLAKKAADVWFATDLDREGEAIAWHLANLLGVEADRAKRVVFNAITAKEIKQAFERPHRLDAGKFDAYQARRVLDRIVGYQVSPLLWKKVARGLSAGRVQSVAVRLIVEREREIREFLPEEYWQLGARFALDCAAAPGLVEAWGRFVESQAANGRGGRKGNGNNNGPTNKAQNQWLAEHGALRAQLFEIDGKKAERLGEAACKDAAKRAGLTNIEANETTDPEGRGPARRLVTVTGTVDPSVRYKIKSIETKRTRSRPAPPFITSTLQQMASTRLGFGARRTMRAAQSLYEGVNLGAEGSVALITYMRTDSTHLSSDAIGMAREHIEQTYGKKYLPQKPNYYSSSDKQAQEAHEAIRPVALDHPPAKVKKFLKADEYKVYQLIWSRFVACQMTPAEWDSTTILIWRQDEKGEVIFKATGRALVFDGFYRETGVPTDSEELLLPELRQGQEAAPFSIDVKQNFTSPPPRYTEASLIRTLESEGIGRPSTYASIIQVIQDRKYVEQVERRFWATDLGEVVTDKLVESFPEILDVGYTREMEAHLDEIAEGELDWVKMMHEFYGSFRRKLEVAEENLTHAKAEVEPAPDKFRCKECGASTVYRFGKNGRFMSCSRYPTCKWASPINRKGEPDEPKPANVACPLCEAPMQERKGRFGAFLGCTKYPDCEGILKLDKKGNPVAPATPPLETDQLCPKCGKALNLRMGKRGPWLSCSDYPKCRGRGAWAKLPDDVRARWDKALAAHLEKNPTPIIRDLEGRALTDRQGNPIVKEDRADLETSDESLSDASAA